MPSLALNVSTLSHLKSGLVEAVEGGSTSSTATSTISKPQSGEKYFFAAHQRPSVDGLVLSPTAHDHSLNYRSATLHLSSPFIVSDEEEKRKSLSAVTGTVAGYDRTKTVGHPMDTAVGRTTVIKCKIGSISCKQRCGGWDSSKEPALEGSEGIVQAWKGGIPCWTQWGDLVGYGRDGEQLHVIFEGRSHEAKSLAVGSLCASDHAKIEGLGRRQRSHNGPY